MKTGEKIVAAAAIAIIAAVAYGFIAAQSAAEYYDGASPVMYFHSAACHFCQEQKAVLAQLSAKGYRVKSMDVGITPGYWQEYGISGTPTFLAANGDTKVGLTPKEELEPWLEAHGAKIK